MATFVGPIGGGLGYFKANAEAIGAFIRNRDLTSATISVKNPKVAREKVIRDINIRGGMLAPHIHFAGRIYLLDEAQWKEFSDTIVANAREHLAKMKQLSFEDAMLLGETITTIGR